MTLQVTSAPVSHMHTHSSAMVSRLFFIRTALHNTHTYTSTPTSAMRWNDCCPQQNVTHTTFTCTWVGMTSASLPTPPKSGKTTSVSTCKAHPLPTVHTHPLKINTTSVSQPENHPLVFVLCVDGQQQSVSEILAGRPAE